MPKFYHIAILVVSSLLIYSNSYNCSWQFDDHPNIVNNTNIHLSSFELKELKNTIYSNGSDKMYRPVACFTFAMNWYVGGMDVFGYHLVNIFIHILSSIFLYLVMVKLLSIKRNNGKKFNHKYEIALLASLLWAVNPVNVQAVTYIVQRMASLAALFSIISIYFYLQFRTQKKNLYLLGGLIFFLLSFFSKENAAILPFSLLLIELVFFMNVSGKQVLKKIPLLILCCIIVFSIAMLFLNINPIGLLKYENRLFTPSQRILTEFRILVYYLYQIIIPNISSLSIHHDIVVSQSLFNPLSTFFSIIFITFMISFSIVSIKRYPLLGFAILFYFLNHIVESSIIGLELMFEHRNYFPSMFLFLPLSYFFVNLRDKYKIKSGFMFYTIHLMILILIICYGMTTYLRNYDWKTEKSLWEDAMEKAPASSRPVHNLAWSYYGRIGDIDKTLEFYKKALSLKFYDIQKKSMILGNIASIYYEMGNRNKALKFMGQAVQENPRIITNKRGLAFMLINYGEHKTARHILKEMIKENKNDIEAIYLFGKSFYITGEYKNAIKEFQKILNSGKKAGVINYLSRSYLKLKLYDNSRLILSLSDSDSLGHNLLKIITANFQKEPKKIDLLFEKFYKNSSALSIKKMKYDKVYIDINQDFATVLDEIFKNRLDKQVQKFKGLK